MHQSTHEEVIAVANTKTHKQSRSKESLSQKRRGKKSSSASSRKVGKNAGASKCPKTPQEARVEAEGHPPVANPESVPSAPAAAADPSTLATADPMVVTVDRRRLPDRRSGTDRRQQNIPVAVERRQLERRAKVPRRRQIDPTTCERDYTPEEIEFMKALDEYKRSSGRMFPTCSEILEVLKKLGYEKRPQPSAQPAMATGRFDAEDDGPALQVTPPCDGVAPPQTPTAETPREDTAPTAVDPSGSDSSV